MKRFLGWLVLAAAVSFTGCGKEDGSIRVLLDWTPNTNHTGLYVALDKGWFEEEGLKVTITQPPEDGALVLLAAGRAEFAIDFQELMVPAIAKRHDALPVTAIAAIINNNTSGIMSLKENNIQRPAELSGKRFAPYDMNVVPLIIQYIVEKDGGNFNEVRIIPDYVTDVFSALQTDVDAIWVYYAHDGIIAEARGIDVNYIDLASFDSIFDFYTPIIVTNTNWAAANSQTVKKFMNAVSRGYNYAMENPGEAADILLKYAPELDREIVIRSQEYLRTRYQGGADRWGEIDRQRWGNFNKWMFEQGILERDIGSEGFTNEYLP